MNKDDKEILNFLERRYTIVFSGLHYSVKGSNFLNSLSDIKYQRFPEEFIYRDHLEIVQDALRLGLIEIDMYPIPYELTATGLDILKMSNFSLIL